MNPFAFAVRGLIRQPGRTILGIAGIAATGALLFDMLMLSRGLVVSMEQLLSGVGFDIRVSATQATPLTGPPITNMADTVAALAALPDIEDVVPLRIGDALVDIGKRSNEVTFMGADVTTRRPWTLVEGRDLTTAVNFRRRLDWTPDSTFDSGLWTFDPDSGLRLRTLDYPRSW